MIRRLQTKIIVILTLLITVIVLVLILSVNIVSRVNGNNRIRQSLSSLAAANGMPPVSERMNDEWDDISYGGFFSVELDQTYRIVRFTADNNLLLTSDVIVRYCEEALSGREAFGYADDYAYLVQERPRGTLIVFLDISSEQKQYDDLLLITTISGCGAVLVLFIGIVLLSFWLVRPVKETLEKQKQFISDAGHELKTPLAVISANVDVLEGEMGENKWLQYIHSETDRMSELVSELLSLARLEDSSAKAPAKVPVDLTELLLQTALPFESQVFEMGKRFEVQAEDGVYVLGDSSALRHVVTILIDNAVKYSSEKGTIRVSLQRQGNKAQIEVYNTGQGIAPDKLEKVFDRFYRENKARNSQSGGYGLGLAIAKASVESLGGTIFAQSKWGQWAKLTVRLPLTSQKPSVQA